MNKSDKISYLSFHIRYSNSVFTETKYMELPKIFFGYFIFLGYLVTMATAFLSYRGMRTRNGERDLGSRHEKPYGLIQIA